MLSVPKDRLKEMPSKRHRQAHYVSAGDKPNDIFGLLQVKGSAGESGCPGP